MNQYIDLNRHRLVNLFIELIGNSKGCINCTCIHSTYYFMSSFHRPIFCSTCVTLVFCSWACANKSNKFNTRYCSHVLCASDEKALSELECSILTCVFGMGLSIVFWLIFVVPMMRVKVVIIQAIWYQLMHTFDFIHIVYISGALSLLNRLAMACSLCAATHRVNNIFHINGDGSMWYRAWWFRDKSNQLVFIEWCLPLQHPSGLVDGPSSYSLSATLCFQFVGQTLSPLPFQSAHWCTVRLHKTMALKCMSYSWLINLTSREVREHRQASPSLYKLSKVLCYKCLMGSVAKGTYKVSSGQGRSDTWFAILVGFMDDHVLCCVHLLIMYIPVCVL